MGGALGGDKAHLVDLLHLAGDGRHDGGDGDLRGLTHLDVALIGVAVVQGEAQLGVVNQGGDGVALVDGVAHLEVGHLPQVARVGGGNAQLRDLVIDGLELLVAVVHRLLGLGHRVAGGGVVHAVELLARGHLVALLDEELQNGARAGRDGGGVLGFGGAAALHHGLDGAPGDEVGHDLALGAVLPEYKVPHQHNERDGDGGDNENSRDRLAPALAFLLRPSGGGRGRGRRGHHWGLLFGHVCSSLKIGDWIAFTIVPQAAGLGITKQ